MAPKNHEEKPQKTGCFRASSLSQDRTSDPEQVAQTRHRKLPTSSRIKRSEWKSKIAAEHDRRKREILEILKPMLANENEQSVSIVLCWGRQDQILPVKISHSADTVALWCEMRRAYYAQRGI